MLMFEEVVAANTAVLTATKEIDTTISGRFTAINLFDLPFDIFLLTRLLSKDLINNICDRPGFRKIIYFIA